jgi:formate hydrogenlyase regulatory protein HycA
MGKCKDGRQFWGYETFVFTEPYSKLKEGDWYECRYDYAVLHVFDSDGNYMTTNYILAGSAAETRGKSLEGEIKNLIAGLGEITYQDIEIRLFQTIIDNITFGLVVDEKNEMITLQPSSTISFQEPWDGEYYT